MINVAILDDYQKVANKCVNWETLSSQVKIKVFNYYIGKDKNLHETLKR